MESRTIKTIGAIAASAALAGSAAIAVAPAILGGQQASATTAAVEASSGSAQSGVVKVANASGAFAYDQAATTSNAQIAGVFNKAASSMCAALPDYNVDALNAAIEVKGPSSFTATVDQMATTAAQTFIITCACASNLAGGGAIANAEVSGVSLQRIAEAAGAK